MSIGEGPREQLLSKIIYWGAEQGIAGKSLRDIAAGAGTSHRMLLYHFGSREGLLAAIVAGIEQQQRDLMTSLAASATTPRELMTALWQQVSSPDLRPFVRLFFEVVGLAAGASAGTEQLLASLTGPWLADGAAAARQLGQQVDTAMLRIGVAVVRGLLLDLVAGADLGEVSASYYAFVETFEANGRYALLVHRRDGTDHGAGGAVM